jgi:hypothetical protein
MLMQATFQPGERGMPALVDIQGPAAHDALDIRLCKRGKGSDEIGLTQKKMQNIRFLSCQLLAQAQAGMEGV